MHAAHGLGARTRLPALIVCAVNLALALSPPNAVALVPKLVFASLLCNIAASFLIEQLHDAWRKLPWFDVAISAHAATRSRNAPPFLREHSRRRAAAPPPPPPRLEPPRVVVHSWPHAFCTLAGVTARCGGGVPP